MNISNSIVAFHLRLIILALTFSSLCCHNSHAQQTPPEIIPTVKLAGPRVGFTYISPGELADDLRSEFEADPFITQFGWQFEKQYFNLKNGTAGLVEAVLLIGGLEQEIFLPSASLLIGLRNAKGFEFGFGPNVSLSGPSFVLAGGITLKSGSMNFPINLALAPSKDGFRWSLLVGFNAREY